MIKKIALVIALSSIPAYAATISVVRSGNGVVATTSAGVVLSGGNYYIGVGAYAAGSVPIVTNDATFIAAVAAFKEFAAAVSPSTGTTAGTITGSFSGIGALPNSPQDFNSQPLYIMVGNGTSRANSTEFAILQGTPAWSFVGDVTIGSASATVSLIDSTAFSPLAGTELDQATGQDRIQMRPIPEPATTLLALLGLGLVTRRKR